MAGNFEKVNKRSGKNVHKNCDEVIKWIALNPSSTGMFSIPEKGCKSRKRSKKATLNLSQLHLETSKAYAIQEEEMAMMRTMKQSIANSPFAFESACDMEDVSLVHRVMNWLQHFDPSLEF